MQCPRCSNTLVEGTYDGRGASHCGSCSGTLFEQSALGAALESLSRNLSPSVNLALPVPPLPDSKGEVACPKCLGVMENYGYMGSNKVMLDACNQCQLVWVDVSELETMLQMQARLDNNMDTFRGAHRPLDISTAAINQHLYSLENRQRRTLTVITSAFLLGFVALGGV